MPDELELNGEDRKHLDELMLEYPMEKDIQEG